MKQAFLCLSLIFLAACGGRVKNRDICLNSPLEQKILAHVDSAKMGKSTSPIFIKHRKLTISEIGQHIEMDEEAVKKYLKSSNIHGYYSLAACNLPSEGKFTLYHINYEGKITRGKEFFVNGNGVLVTKLDDQFVEFNNNFLFFSNYLPGEPANFALVSHDQTLIATAKIIPNPIQKADNDHHEISLEIASADKRCYLVHCFGLEPFGSYLLKTSFENEQFAYPFEASSSGEAFIRTGPNTPWITGGRGTLELRGEGVSTPLFLEFTWGE